MRTTSNGNGDDAECTECSPPRKFKSKSGLNGHTQFKHGHLPDSRAMIPHGKQSQMYENLTDRVNQLIDQQEELLELARNGNGNGNDQGNGNGNSQVNGNGNGQVNGNGNGQVNGNGNDQGNGNGNGQVNGNGNGLALGKVNGNGASHEQIGVLSGRLEQPDEPQQAHCNACQTSFDFDTHPRNCAGCGDQFDWNGLEGKSTLWGLIS